MSYRIHERPRPEPRRSMQKTATPSKVFVHNGATFELAIPCWYLVAEPPVPSHPHDWHWHDHVGWPSPEHPDHSCQMHAPDWHAFEIEEFGELHHPRYLLDMGAIQPIHLLQEGYENVVVRFAEGLPDGVEVEGWIDYDDDWVVRIRFDVDTAYSDEESKHRFSAFVVHPATETMRERRDLVCLGELIILPSASYGTDDQSE